MNFILYLGFLLLVLVFFGHYFLQRLEEHNYKIMTLAEILTSISSDIQNIRVNKKQQEEPLQADEEIKEILLTVDTNANHNLSDSRIYVSDDEDDDDDVTDNDDDEDDEDENDVVNDDDTNTPIRLVNIFGSLENQLFQFAENAFAVHVTTERQQQKRNVYEISQIDEEMGEGISNALSSENILSENILSENLSSGNLSYENLESDTLLSDTVSEQVQQVTLEQFLDEQTEQLNEQELGSDVHEEQHVKEQGEDIKASTLNYKNYSVDQLKKLVTQKGLSTKVSKMKKNDLIQLLVTNE
jgi:hypothetical protein